MRNVDGMRAWMLFLGIMWMGLGLGTANSQPARSEKALTHVEEKSAAKEFEGRTLRLASWNIEWFPAGQRNSKKENVEMQMRAVAGIIGELKPDILFTQETRNLGALIRLNREYLGGKFKFLASSLYYAENTKGETEDVQQQNGIMSVFPWKLDPVEMDFATAEYYKGRPARGWLRCEFEFAGRRVVFYNGHLKSNYGAKNEKKRAENYTKRESAIRYLGEELKAQGLDPLKDLIVVLGDFNTDYFSEEFKEEKTLRMLEAMGFRHTFGGMDASERVTSPSRLDDTLQIPDSTLDYIWISKGWGEAVPKASVLKKGASRRVGVFGGDEEGLASDHYPVLVELTIP